MYRIVMTTMLIRMKLLLIMLFLLIIGNNRKMDPLFPISKQ